MVLDDPAQRRDALALAARLLLGGKPALRWRERARVDQPAMLAAPDVEGPPAEMQRLMADLEKLDQQAETLPPDALGPNINLRIAKLKELAKLAADAEMREAWEPLLGPSIVYAHR